jgi:hypothetical protein
MGRKIAVAILVVVFLVLLVLVLPTFRGGMAPPGSESELPARTGADSPDVILEHCARVGDSVTAEGWVRNEMIETVRYVELRLHWTDPTGAEIETEFVEVVGSESLMVGDSASFRFSNTDPRVAGCTAEVYSYDPFF